MSFSINHFSSKINKECTNLDKYYSSLDSKPLVQKQMEASMTKMPGKRLILPKTINSKTSSMSLKNVSNHQISKDRYNNSNGKVVIRTVYPVSNAVKRVLQTKPKIGLSTANLAKFAQQQIIIAEVHNTSQSQALVADAELIHSQSTTPARDQSAYNSALANNSTSAEISTINGNYCTNNNNVNNTDTVAEEYCTNIDKNRHQGVDLQPGGQLYVGLNYCPKNFDPFLSDSKLTELASKPEKILDISSIELVRDIETLNTDKVLKQEDSEKDEILAEGYIPIATNKTGEQMENFDFLSTWGPEALYNDTQPMEGISQPMDDMVMVNPLTVEGRTFENATMENVTNSTTTAQTQQPLSTPQPEIEDMASLDDMKEALDSLDEEWVASMLIDIENNPEGSTTENNVPAENNLLEMIINDSIGVDTVAEVCNDTYTTLNPEDIDVSTEDETTQEGNQGHEVVVSASVQKRKGPGRPRKARTTERVVKPRGRPTKVHVENANLMTEHHNYSNSGASKSASSSAEKRYRRMRDLNNVASQRCRLKRKEKMNSTVDELKEEEERNKGLKMRVRVLEEQVKALKASFINKIANPTRVLPSPENSSSEWNSAQLERFVDDVANRHLGM